MHYNFTDSWNCTIISTETLYTSRLPYFGNIIIILYSEKDKKISIRGRNRSVQNAVKFLSSWISLLSHIIIHSGSWNIAKVLWILIGYIFCKKEYYYELAKLKMVSLISNSCFNGRWLKHILLIKNCFTFCSTAQINWIFVKNGRKRF